MQQQSRVMRASADQRFVGAHTSRERRNCTVAKSCVDATACAPFAQALIKELMVITIGVTSCNRIVTVRLALTCGHRA